MQDGGEDDMSSHARYAGSRPLCGEGNLIERGLLTRGWSRRGGGEKLSVDSDCTKLRGTVRLPRWGVVAVLRKVAFSSRKAVLVAKKETNYYWWGSC